MERRKSIEEKKGEMAILINRWTESQYTLSKINELYFLSSESEIIEIDNKELLREDNYIIQEGCIGIPSHGSEWVLCNPDDDMHEKRKIRDGRVVNPCGDPIGRVHDYIRIRTSTSRSLDYNLTV